MSFSEDRRVFVPCPLGLPLPGGHSQSYGTSVPCLSARHTLHTTALRGIFTKSPHFPKVGLRSWPCLDRVNFAHANGGHLRPCLSEPSDHLKIPRTPMSGQHMPHKHELSCSSFQNTPSDKERAKKNMNDIKPIRNVPVALGHITWMSRMGQSKTPWQPWHRPRTSTCWLTGDRAAHGTTSPQDAAHSRGLAWRRGPVHRAHKT